MKQWMYNAKWENRLENRSEYYTSIPKTHKEKAVQNSLVGLERLLSFHSSPVNSGSLEFKSI